MSRVTILCVFCACLARAQTPVGAFATFDRQSFGGYTSLDLGITIPDGGDGNALRLDLYGQTEFGAGGVGLSLPFSMVVEGADTLADGVGNLEITGFADFERRSFGVNVHGGVLLPTAADDPQSMVANTAAVVPRLTDTIQVVPKILGLRFAASPRFLWRWLVFRGDLGVDLGVPVGDGASKRDVIAYFRGNLGLGLRVGLLMLTTEFVNLGNLGEAPGDERFLHTAATTLSVATRYVDAHVGFVVPLDESLRDDLLAVTLGIAIHWGDIF